MRTERRNPEPLCAGVCVCEQKLCDTTGRFDNFMSAIDKNERKKHYKESVFWWEFPEEL